MKDSLRSRIDELSNRERQVLRKVLNVPKRVRLADFIQRELAALDQQRTEGDPDPRGRLADLQRILREKASG
jgi:hypothetical protein